MSTLKELLNYRKKCIIHGKQLRPVQLRGLSFDLSKDQLSLSILRGRKKDSILCNLTFKDDGTYTCTKDCFKYIDNVVSLYMICDECRKFPLDALSHITSLNNIWNVQYFYTFDLTALPKNDKYDGELGTEEIRYCVDDKFYHTSVNLMNKAATCEMGKCARTDTLKEIVEGRFIINVPHLNMDKIKNLEQYLNKMKLYSIFS